MARTLMVHLKPVAVEVPLHASEATIIKLLDTATPTWQEYSEY